MREYQAQRAMALAADVEGRRARSEQFSKLVLATRDELAALYREPLSADVMRTRKAVVFDELRHRYAQLRDQQWGGKGWYDPFFGAPLNNASLLPFGLYDDQIPEFEELFAESGRDRRRSFDAQSRLAPLGASQRDIRRGRGRA